MWRTSVLMPFCQKTTRIGHLSILLQDMVARRIFYLPCTHVHKMFQIRQGATPCTFLGIFPVTTITNTAGEGLWITSFPRTRTCLPRQTRAATLLCTPWQLLPAGRAPRFSRT
ncbi:hypothetical protein ATCV1_z569R [Acanthocystis turfacea chlorella virus 1]|uniref:Uncharacterized protein z569R n=1 Tax=Chlorovirus heliozoae TaxID=322019 RepID=A7K9H9_9PHYC|nr:hypothetical protein ATCV1_z569R [Acanthocystis turfacea chlorella virus 1]ABT16703.1 hypothetical protein ATCV1_z569R [Acanthocystis turfacea chlorella virus 1]